MVYQFASVIENGVNSTTNWFKPMRIGQFYGVASFAVEGICLILPIRSTMKDYKSFRWIFHSIGGGTVAWYFLFGMSGAMVAFNKGSGLAIRFQESFFSDTQSHSR
jgi:hypothetical protein